MLQRIATLVVLAVFALTQLSGQSGDGPTLRVVPQSGSILIEASDTQGLDSLDISCKETDSSYHTQLSRSKIGRHFKRTFTLAEVFPDAAGLKDPLTITATVRNTRGQTRSTTVRITPK